MPISVYRAAPLIMKIPTDSKEGVYDRNLLTTGFMATTITSLLWKKQGISCEDDRRPPPTGSPPHATGSHV